MKRVLYPYLLILLAMLTQGLATASAADKPAPGATVAEAPVLVRGEAWRWGASNDGTETFLSEREGYLVFYRESSKFTGERYRTKELNLVKDIKDGAGVSWGRTKLSHQI